MIVLVIAGILWALTAVVVIATLLPLSKLPFGAVRGGEFPREQICVLAVILCVALPFAQGGEAGAIGAAVLALIALVQLAYIAKFTPVWSKQSVSADDDLRADKDRQISLLTANVKKSNREYRHLIEMTKARQPDIMMAIEVDDDWIDALKDGLSELYPHWIDIPKDTGYGLCLMSRLPLFDIQVRDLIVEGVPSIRTGVKLPNGMRLRLYVVHPEPPVMSQDTKGRDSEIAKVGLEADDDALPAIVTGDLNDVAWSTTTRRFQRLSGLLDPRVGRGFYNTFSATMPWMRWPLDHLFHCAKFRLVEMERLGKIGSDHFPMWFKLALTGEEAAESAPDDSEAEEVAETREMIAEERERSRDPIGTDWEDE